MADLHYLRFRVHVHATEDPDIVEAALGFITGGAPAVEVDELEGHHGNPIRVLESSLESSGDVRAFLDRLTADPATGTTLLRELERRVDDDCNLYLRLGKQDAARGHLALAVDDDVVRVRGKVAAYPAKREVALARLRAILEARPGKR